jgi:hypothetical protein
VSADGLDQDGGAEKKSRQVSQLVNGKSRQMSKLLMGLAVRIVMVEAEMKTANQADSIDCLMYRIGVFKV